MNTCCSLSPPCLCSHYSLHSKPLLSSSSLNNLSPLTSFGIAIYPIHTHIHIYTHRHLSLLKSFLFSKQARFDFKITTFINLPQSCSIYPVKINPSSLGVSNDHLWASLAFASEIYIQPWRTRSCSSVNPQLSRAWCCECRQGFWFFSGKRQYDNTRNYHWTQARISYFLFFTPTSTFYSAQMMKRLLH